jgi:cobalt-precorrin-5B (C1)-methyltransferase
MSVAYNSGCEEVVLTSGKRSENRLRSEFSYLPDTAFIHFGNLVGDSVKLAVQQGITKINLALMLGKAVKLAEGNLDTHSKNVQFNPAFLAQIASECGYYDDIVSQIGKLQIANAIFPILPVTENLLFYQEIARKCYRVCHVLMPDYNVFRFVLLLEGTHVFAE